MRGKVFLYSVIMLYTVAAVVLSGCALSSKPVPQATADTEGLVIEQGIFVGPLDINILVQAVLHNDGGGQFTIRGKGGAVVFTKDDGCLWHWTSTVNNTGGTVCVKNPAELVRQEMANHNPYKIPSILKVDTYGVELPKLPDYQYLAGLKQVSGDRTYQMGPRYLTVAEIRGLVRKVQSEGGELQFPPDDRIPGTVGGYTIRLKKLDGCQWNWEHLTTDSNGAEEVFASGTVTDCDLAQSDMIPFMLTWR